MAKNSSGKNILVTGGTGYIGHRVALALNKGGYKVTVADKVAPVKRNIVFPKEITFILGDLREQKVAEKAVKGNEYVIHLAANIGSLTYMHDHQAEIIQENSAIDAALYPAMVKADTKVVLYSSSSMVFQKSTVFPYREVDISRVYLPTNVYGFSKLLGEYFCKSYRKQYGLNYVIMRYHNVYGPGENRKGTASGDIHVIPALVAKVLSGQYPLEFVGDHQATRPFVFIDDAVGATLRLTEEALMRNKKVLNEDFNIGPRKAIRILDLGKLIWEMLGDGRPFKYKAIKTNAVTAKKRETDPYKIESVIGWQPKISLEDGIKLVADWLKSRSSSRLREINNNAVQI